MIVMGSKRSSWGTAARKQPEFFEATYAREGFFGISTRVRARGLAFEKQSSFFNRP